ncbi:MAG TPA: aminotransferase class III-fold pyridoxal phosphate-dependent enzyme [Candidatus Limnocylindrales bacterium]|nr:aminotransferase class III-fold pyridoxal phosphate-dependent enzyme [Candidatus Limnocylindrales bacterium]
MSAAATVRADQTSVFPRFLDLAYPNIERGQGVWLETAAGDRILDACSGGAMVACLGYGVREIVEAAARQAELVAYFYNHHFTTEPQEELADRIIEVVAPEMARVKFGTGGSEANETALRLARAYHVDRGQRDRWKVITQAQAYHGSTLGTLALSGRPRSLQAPYLEYLPPYLHIPPPKDADQALKDLDRALAEAGPQTVSAYFCEPISAAAYPAYSPPARFWEGLAERRDKHGFVVCFDEIVTGVGRTGSWLAAHQLPIEPDIVTIGKGIGAGYWPLSAVLCREHIYVALAEGSAEFDLGHTWDGAPLPSAVGVAVLDYIVRHRLVDRVRELGPGLLAQLKSALKEIDIVGDVRGRGFLLGVSLVDPSNRTSFLPHELDAATMVDDIAFEHGVLVSSTHSTPDGFAGDEVVLAPAFTSTEDELRQMVERFLDAMRAVDRAVKQRL